jgi:hemerythrin-like domain-containing protein
MNPEPKQTPGITDRESPYPRESDVPQAIITLRHEHRYFESILKVLDQQAAAAAEGDCDFPLLQDIVQYLISYPDAYHHPREDRVFERLLQIDPASRNAVQGLIHGHTAMYRETKRLRDAVERALDGQDADIDRLRVLLERYTESYRAHMKTEDEVVFPLAMEIFTPEDWEQAGRRYRQDQDPLFGPVVKQKYQRLAEGLYTRAELVRRRFAVAEVIGIESTIEGMATLSAAAWDVGRVVSERTRDSIRDNLASVKERVTSGDSKDLVKLPVDILRNNWAQLDSGLREIGEILGQAGEDIRKPYSTRMESLKGLLRRDWDE